MNHSYLTSTSYTATAPSNIALVKYWGKKDAATQWPANDSISMTLSESRTTTTARRIEGLVDWFTFGGVTISSETHRDHKIFRHLNRMREALGVSGSLSVESQNTFPTGCGIASSASGFAALTLASAAALTDEFTWERLAIRGATQEKLAHLARLGSGSAGRSVFGGFVTWSAGENPESQRISQSFSPDHWNLSDVIIVFSDQEKHVSSSEAHIAAWGSPLFPPRLSGIPERMRVTKQAIEKRDLAALGREMEADALEMHAVAMTGSPSVNYFRQDTVDYISWIRSERAAGLLPAWFTIDAGPNVHMICDSRDLNHVVARAKARWPQSHIIVDHVGRGPTIEKTENGTDAKGVKHV